MDSYHSKNNSTFCGNIPFGSFFEKAVICTTYNNYIYIHIKDRSRNKTVTLKSEDFLHLLRLKDKVITMTERAAKLIAKQNKENISNNVTDFENDSYIIGSDIEEEVLGKVSTSGKNRKRKNPKPDLTDSESSEEEVVKSKPKKKRGPKPGSKKAVSNTYSDSESDGGKSKKHNKQNKKKAAAHNLIRTVSSATASSQD